MTVNADIYAKFFFFIATEIEIKTQIFTLQLL